jgi:hypothetical protein
MAKAGKKSSTPARRTEREPKVQAAEGRATGTGGAQGVGRWTVTSKWLGSRRRPQRQRIQDAVKKLYPDGKVPDEITTAFVRGQVNRALAADSRNLGLADASWDTVNRALGRG